MFHVDSFLQALEDDFEAGHPSTHHRLATRNVSQRLTRPTPLAGVGTLGHRPNEMSRGTFRADRKPDTSDVHICSVRMGMYGGSGEHGQCR